MTKAKKIIVEDVAIATEEIQQDEIQQEIPSSDHKVILAPLAKYGVIAIIMASIIVTTAIMMNKEFNEIDTQVAALGAEIAQQNSVSTQPETIVTDEETVAVVEKTTKAEVVTEVVISKNSIAKQTTLPVITLPVATASAEPAITVTAPAKPVTDTKARIAKHHEYLAAQDTKQLDILKANQAKVIERLREQLVHQQEQITAIEMRNQEYYEMRVTAVKRMQDSREKSLNRI